MKLTEKGAHAPRWTPFREWANTPEARRELVLFLADLARVNGMGDTIAAGLAELAGHLDEEQQWLRFEVLVEALRDRRDADDHDLTKACVRVDEAVADLCEAAS